MKARVTVSLKNGILDPQGRSIAQTLHHLGFTGVHDARVSKMIELEVDGKVTRAEIEDMAQRLLANTVIENYQVEFL